MTNKKGGVLSLKTAIPSEPAAGTPVEVSAFPVYNPMVVDSDSHCPAWWSHGL